MVKWILSPDTFGENLVNLKSEIIKQGHTVIDIEKYFQFRVEINDGYYGTLHDDSVPAIFYGSIESGQHILRTCSVYPGVYCDLDKFKCSAYYPYVSKYLINNPYSFLPMGSVESQMEWLFEMFGEDRCIFIRPDTGAKLFTGNVFKKEELASEFKNIRFDVDDMVVIARPRDIDEEFRLVYGDGKYITSSRYKCNGKLNKAEECFTPYEVIALGNEIAQAYQPERVFVLDIGMTAKGPQLIEFNSFSCSGLYFCNLEKIVREVSKIVEDDWDDMYGIPF